MRTTENLGSAYAAGAMLLSTLTATYALAVINFMLGGTIDAWIFPTAFAASAICGLALSSHKRNAIKAILLCAAVTVPAVIISHYVEDYSSDGNSYHQEQIALMLGGWNPFRTDGSEFGASIWAMHYPKAMETIQAAVAATFNSIESGKAINILIIFAAIFITYGVLRQYVAPKNSKRLTAICATAVVALNPVGVGQILTYFIDFSIYYYIVITIALAIRIFNDKATDVYFLMAFTAILAIGTKFNAFFYEGIAFLAILAAALASRRMPTARNVAFCGIAALVAGLALAFHPYATNMLSHGHPLYPLMGEGAYDIMSRYTPVEYIGNRFADFFISMFKVERGSYDMRFGGFTPLMPLMLVMSIVAFVKFKDLRRAPLYIALCAFASCFFFEQTWWSRYIPQLWLVPASACCGLVSFADDKTAKWLRAGFVVASLCASAVILRGTVLDSIRMTDWRRNIYELKAGKVVRVVNPTPQMIRHFNERRMECEVCTLDDIDFDNSVFYFGYNHPEDLPVVEMNEDEYEHIVRATTYNNILAYPNTARCLRFATANRQWDEEQRKKMFKDGPEVP